MYGRWTENVVLQSNFLGFIWDFKNFGQQERKFNFFYILKDCPFWRDNFKNRFIKIIQWLPRKCNKNSTVNYKISCLGTAGQNKNLFLSSKITNIIQ